MRLFNENIGNWDEWGALFQSIPAFAPLVAYILQREGLPNAKLSNLTPGTNAVFRAGGYVVKVFAPPESGFDQTEDMRTELFATRRANALGVAAPRLVADGFVEDKYRFAYLITEFIDGKDLKSALNSAGYLHNPDGDNHNVKRRVGENLRRAADAMNAPCGPFNAVDTTSGESRFPVWDSFSENFMRERAEYISARDFGEKIFVHGDLCADNILVTRGGDIYIIDFADSVLAPRAYEHALVAAELLFLDAELARGFFGDYDPVDLAGVVFDGLLLHAFGGGIIAQRIADPAKITGLADLKNKIAKLIISCLLPRS